MPVMQRPGWKRMVVIGLAALLAAPVLHAVTTNFYYVASSGSATGPFDTWEKAATDIQTAVSTASASFAAGSVDCVVTVSNGTYMLTSQILITNGITLRSLNGRDVTIINGNYPAVSNRCIEIRNAPTPVTLDGFTLSNGYAYIQQAGGGLFVTNSPAWILNCAVLSNRTSFSAAGLGYGGGIGIASTNYLLMSNCLISANVLMNNAGVAGGAGLWVAGAPGLIVDCQIKDHTTSGNITGGGVILSGGAPRLTMLRCLIQNNYSDRYVGGINVAGFTTIDNCTIDNNSTRSAHGGLKCDSDSGIITNCVISRNRAGGEGVGGVSLSRGYMVNCQIVSNYTSLNGGGVSTERNIRNCLIAANRADNQGGGVLRQSTSVGNIMMNCTIVRNDAGNGGGGVYNLATFAGLFTNCIVAHNEGLFIDDISGYKTNFVNSCSPDLVAGVNSNVVTDPQFVDPGSGFGTNAVLGDYRLVPGSPAIDSGSAAGVLSLDINGVVRPKDGDGNGIAANDMGAYEAPAATDGVFRCGFSTPTNVALDALDAVFTASAAGLNTNGLAYLWIFGDGTTSDWSSATRVIAHSYGLGAFQVTLNVSNELGQTAGYTRPGYVLVHPSYVYVATNGGSAPPYGDWATAATTIQAGIYKAAEAVGYTKAVLVSGGVYTVLSEIMLTNAVVVRGFSGNRNDAVIRGGFPASTNRCLTISHGAAVLDGFTVTNGNIGVAQGGGITMSAGTVQNCLIIGNKATGGATLGAGAGVYCGGGMVTNCEIRNNTANNDGGGVFNNGTLVDCLIAGNTTGANGGGVRTGGGLTDRCVIIGNSTIGASGGGGGVAKGNSGGAVVRNCLIAGNASKFVGGGVYQGAGSSFDLQNCTITGNSATNGGGAYFGAGVHLGVNCILALNQATKAGGTNDLSGLVALVFTNSCSPNLMAGVSNNVAANPQFYRPGTGFGTGWTGGNYRLTSGSPCVDSGASSAWMSVSLDLDGLPRILGAGPNMGAYERVFKTSGSLLLIR